jgi:hypothetical protein
VDFSEERQIHKEKKQALPAIPWIDTYSLFGAQHCRSDTIHQHLPVLLFKAVA